MTIPVTNTGLVDGSKYEFISDEYSSISPANKKLNHLQSKISFWESLKISFNLTADDFAFVNDVGERILEKGTFFIEILDQKVKI